MKKIYLIVSGLLLGSFVFAQVDTTTKRSTTVTIAKPKFATRSNDHLLIEVGYAAWSGKPDSIKTTGVPRSFNAYFMFDFPFKTNPKISAAIGGGISTDNIYFKKTSVGLKEQTVTIPFKNLTDTSHFKKYKLATAWLEAPVELRFSSNPNDNGKSFKVALGAKIGTLLNAHTKGKTLQDKADKTLIAYMAKENSKHYFNTTRLSLTGRIGYGHLTIFGNYSVTALFKEGTAAVIHPFTVGLALSGL